MADNDYYEAIKHWRATLDDSLRNENSWLALAGLIWLELGSTPFGADENLAIVLKIQELAAIAGEFVRDDAGVELIVHHGSDVRIDGKHLDRVRLNPDASGSPQMVTVGPYSMMLIERGDRLGIRLWDNGRAARRSFSGRVWYPVDPVYCLKARFFAHDPPKTMVIPNELGETESVPSPGTVEFDLGETTYRLDALEGPEGGLFLLVKDGTSGDETYGSGRFLVTPSPDQAEVTLDFNRAYNPPCAFTPYATCPLPPEQNDLPVAIRAGEKRPQPTSSDVS